MLEEGENSNWFLVLIGISCLAIISSAFYFFYYQKDYQFIVEASCDVSLETCFERDCSNPDDCPANGLSTFKRYSLNANDFEKCTNGDCTVLCESGAVKCEPVLCTENLDIGESCSFLEASTNNE